LLEWRNLVCGVMIVVAPASLGAQSTGGALLHSDGGTWLNGSLAPATSAIFPDSLVQTAKGHRAKIDAEGSTVLIQPETMVQFQGNELALDHGSLQLDTARELNVIIGCITISPLTSGRTQYDVTDVDGTVKVVASKNDVKIHYNGTLARKAKMGASSDVIVHEGEQASRAERCATGKPAHGWTDGDLLDSPWAKAAGIVAVGVIACFGLCHSSNPLSPWKP
jgi:hypothetical protein